MASSAQKKKQTTLSTSFYNNDVLINREFSISYKEKVNGVLLKSRSITARQLREITKRSYKGICDRLDTCFDDRLVVRLRVKGVFIFSAR